MHKKIKIKKCVTFVVYFYFFEGPGHCRSFIHHNIKKSTKVGNLLPKFDSKILISWGLFEAHTYPGGGRSASYGCEWKKRGKLKKERRSKKEKDVVSFYFLKVKMSEDTRSARRYCNTGATSSRGDTQACQAQDRGLNKSLKLMWRHAPRTRD